MNRDEKLGILLSLCGGLGFFFGALNQAQGLALAILGFVLIYVQSLQGSTKE